MKMTIANLILIITSVCVALVAGLLYGYSCSVNPGLGKLGDREYIAAMQSINAAIQNPVFFVSFMGSLLLLPVSAWLHYHQPQFKVLLSAAILYFLGVFCITMLKNVPLNEALKSFNLSAASPDSISARRSSFEIPWVFWHNVRTVASIVTLVLVLIGCIYKSGSAGTKPGSVSAIL